MKILYILLTIFTLIYGCNVNAKDKTNKKIMYEAHFNATNSYDYVKNQTDMGPRSYSSASHREVREYIKETIKSFGYEPFSHNFNAPFIKNRKGENIYAFLKGKSDKYIVLGSHFDSRSVADKDENNAFIDKPISGANDGASSTGVLLELMRVLKQYENTLDYSVVFIFFDLEDDGGLFEIEGDKSKLLTTDWIQGSIAFVKDIIKKESIINKKDIVFGVLLDMVGSYDAQFLFESYAYHKYSNIYNKVWGIAQRLGYSNYFYYDEYGLIIDDHTPFIEYDIPFINIIDMGYIYHHTQEDTIDKIDTNTLNVVGSLVEYIVLHPKEVLN